MSEFEYDESDFLGTVTLTLDDDTELECLVLTTYSADGKDYIALLPMKDGEPDEEADILIYRYIDHGDDEDPELENIDSDEEFDAAIDAFKELQDEAIFEEEDSEEE